MNQRTAFLSLARVHAKKNYFQKGFTLAGLYQHTPCKDGSLLFHARFENSAGEKTFRQFCYVATGEDKGFKNGLSALEAFFKVHKRPLFTGITLETPEPLPILPGDTVLVVEGHKLVVALRKIGVKAVTSGSGNSHGFADCGELKGPLNLRLWPDNDKGGIHHSREMGENFKSLGHNVQFVDIEKLNLPDKGDFIDWLKLNPDSGAEGVLALALLDALPENEDTPRAEKWETPEPLDNQTLPAERLPYEALPDALVLWIKDEANRMQSPPDWLAVSALILASSLIGTRCAVRPAQYDDWLCVPNLWGGAVGPPSTMKSPCLSKGIGPLDFLEVEALEIYENAFKDYSKLNQKYEIQKKGIASACHTEWKKKTRNTDLIKRLEGELDSLTDSAPLAPVWKRYRVEDITVEKAGMVLAENPHGLLVFCDELSAMFARWDKPGRESERAFYLKAFEGKQPDISDKVTRGTTQAERVCLSVCGAITPDKLKHFLYELIYGMGNDGLFQRFQLLVWPDDIPDYKLIELSPDMKARARAYNAIQKIASLDFKSLDAQKQGEDFYLPFSAEAQPIYNEWIKTLEGKLRGEYSKLHSVFREHFGKYRGLMPSLALIFQLIDTADLLCRGGSVKALTISNRNALKACAFVDNYLTSHAFKIYGLALDSKGRASDVLAEKIKTGKISDGFTVKEIQERKWKGLTTALNIKEACDILIGKNWLKLIDGRGGYGQPGKITYLINPEIKGGSDID